MTTPVVWPAEKSGHASASVGGTGGDYEGYGTSVEAQWTPLRGKDEISAMFRRILRQREVSAASARTVDIREVKARVAELSHLPTLSSLASSLRMALREDGNLQELNRLIEQDPGVTGRLLHLANSAFYRGEREVEDVEEAVMQLGFKRVRELIVFSRVVDNSTLLAKDFDWECLWRHNIAVGTIAEDIGRFFGYEDVPIQTAGVLHDIGKVILSDLYPDVYSVVLARACEEGTPLEAAEHEAFGLGHEHIGELFAEVQRLPIRHIQAIRFHREPLETEAGRWEASVVQVANYLAKLHGLGFSGDRTYLDTDYAQLSGYPHLLATCPDFIRHQIERNPRFFPVSMMASLRQTRALLDSVFRNRKPAEATVPAENNRVG